MTRNQLEYAKLENEKKQFERTQAETERHNRASLNETIRSNQAREKETNRSNLINEGLKSSTLSEQIRSNQTRERETERSNKASEAETNRSNLAKETELNRSNLARETETKRSNIAKETETHRSNVINESLTSERNAIARETNLINEEHYIRQDSEQERSNRANEQLQSERNRTELAKVQLGYDQIEGNYRNVLTSAGATRYVADTNANVAYANLAEQTRSNIADELLRTQQALEAVRSTRQKEQLERERLQIQGYGAQTQRLAQQQTANEWNSAKQANIQSQTQLNNQRAKSEVVHRRNETINTATGVLGTLSNAVNGLGRNITSVIPILR